MRVRIKNEIVETNRISIKDGCRISIDDHHSKYMVVYTGKQTEKVFEQLLEKGFADLSQYNM